MRWRRRVRGQRGHFGGLEPFFELRPGTKDDEWFATAWAPSLNHMGTVHGGALSLLLTDVATRACRSQSAERKVPSWLSIAFLRPVQGEVALRTQLDASSRDCIVTVEAAVNGRVCASGYVGGFVADGSGRPIFWNDQTFRGEPMTTGPVPFRDQMGVRLLGKRDGSLFASWRPTADAAESAVRNGRMLALAALLVDIGGSIVNVDEDGNLVARYATISLSVAIQSHELVELTGDTEIREIGDGRRVRFTGASLVGPSGWVYGRGTAQFVSTSSFRPPSEISGEALA